MPELKLIRKFIILALLCLALGYSGQALAINQQMLAPHAQAMPLLPFLDYIIDDNGAFDVEEASKSAEWQPLIPSQLPRIEGIIWLRFTIAPLAQGARPQTYLLDMGQSVPGTPILYEPAVNELSGSSEWRESLPGERNTLLLPEAANEAQVCYIRMDGLPGPWFAPMIRTPQNAANNWGSLCRYGAILALALVAFFCVLRGMAETGQWRYWTALYAAAALIQAAIGMPWLESSWTISNLAAILCPGLALMFLPHVGRHLLEANQYSRSIDIQLFLLSLPGACLAILPLVPGWDWLFRWLELWPLLIILFLPTALAAWIMRMPGGLRFLLACLIPPVFTAIALIGLEFGRSANVLASGPAWGVALSALLLVAAAVPNLAKATPEKSAKKEPAALRLESDPKPETVITLEHPLDDPNLRLLAPAETENIPQPARVVERELWELEPRESDARELAMRNPLDAILRDAANLAKCSLPPTARQYVEGMTQASQQLADILTKPGKPRLAGSQVGLAEESFNLQRVIRNAHDSVAPMAEASGTSLSWYMPPHLSQLYRGDARSLEETLRLLLESSARATQHGIIKISARRVPDSRDPGHILFTITDNGDGYPPVDRSSLALAKAWELAGEYSGVLNVECSQHGASVAFSAHFLPLADVEDDPFAENAAHVILASPDANSRRQLRRIIETVPCVISEAATEDEVLDCQNDHPACLLVAQGSHARPSAGDMIRAATRIARNAGLKSCHILAITPDDSQWALLKASGFTHAMLEPVDPEILRRTIIKLTENPNQNLAQSDSESKEQSPGQDEAPTMLCEQDFSLAASFEGPEWLQADEDEPKPEQERTEQPTPMESEFKEEQGDTVETKFLAPESAVEWVGEPMPVPPKPQPEAEAEEDDKQLDKDGSVELADSALSTENETDFNHKNTSVKNFVSNSVSLVANTLSNMLSQQADASQPAREQQQSQSDPAIMALIRRLDEAMNQANAAFAAQNANAIAGAAALITRDAEDFGLRLLARLANCVERAARHNDLNALNDILPDLQAGIERNKIALTQKGN